MLFNRLITHGAVAVGLSVVTGAGSPGSDCPAPSPAVGYYERCVGAVAPALSLRPEEPAAGDSPLSRLTKLRYASALRRLELAAQRVADHQDAPDKLLPILKDLGESRLELCDDPAALIPVLAARLGLARLIEEVKECEVEVGRSAKHNLEDARYARLDAEVQLARARAALKAQRRDGAVMMRPGVSRMAETAGDGAGTEYSLGHPNLVYSRSNPSRIKRTASEDATA
jgi:hypothetical protein